MLEELNREEQHVLMIKGRAEQRLAHAPAGKLRVSVSHGKTQFYQKGGESGSNRSKYLSPKTKSELINQLIRKEYDQQVLWRAKSFLASVGAVREELKCMGYCSASSRERPLLALDGTNPVVCFADGQQDLRCQPTPPLTPFKWLCEEINDYGRGCLDPFVLPDDIFIAEWCNRKPWKYAPYPERRMYSTSRNVMVRSKSEVIIADRLALADVPFRYEIPVLLGDTLVFPDFLVLNVRTRQEHLWEHFGMMSDSSYANRAIEKIAKYAKHGLGIGSGLIATFESTGQQLSLEVIDNYIDAILR